MAAGAVRLSIDVPQEVLPKIWRRWQRCEAVKLEQSDDGRVTLLVSYDLTADVRQELELHFDLGEAA